MTRRPIVLGTRPLGLAAGLALLLLAQLLGPPRAALGEPRPPEKEPGPDRAGFVPHHVLIRFRPGTAPSGRAGVRARHELELIRQLPLPGLELVRIRDGRHPLEVAARLSAERSVWYAEPNALWYPDDLPNDPDFPELWGLHNTGQTGGTADADIDAPEAWDIDADSSGIVVAVIDTGVWIEHPDLQPNVWVNPGEIAGNGIDDDANGYVDDLHGWDFFHDDGSVFDEGDLDDHGTHVAGTIAAATGNGTDVSGVSAARIMALKFIGPEGGTTADAVEALDYAIDNGAHVANNSWGGGGSAALQDKIEEANQAGLLFVAAAGNGGVDGVGDDNDAVPFYPASYPNDNVLAVAATTHADDLALFSNFGAASVDVGAPGQEILSTVPRFAKAVLVGPETDAGVAYRSALHSFGLEGVLATADRQALLSAALTWMGVGTGDPVLVVDDDRGENYEGAYTGTLAALGYVNVTTATVPLGGGCPTRSGPSAATMAAHRVVVWLVGYDFDCTLNASDRSNLSTYLDGGLDRNLLLFGQDLDNDLTDGGALINPFLRDYLRVDYLADFDLNLRPTGMPGTPYASVPMVELDPGLPPILGEDPTGQFWSSPLGVRPGAVGGMRGAPTAWFDGTSMATPHVTAAAAQVMAKFPGLTHLEVKSRLMSTGDPVPALAGTTVSGRRLNLASALASSGLLPPTGLEATAKAAGQIDLSWSLPGGPNVAGYNVYRGTTVGFPPGPGNRIASLVAGTTYTDPGSNTIDGTTYYYVVRAEDDGAAESDDSNEASAVADKTAPGPPSGLTIPAGPGWAEDHITQANAASVAVTGTKTPDTVRVRLTFSQDANERVRTLSGLGAGTSFIDPTGVDTTMPPSFADGPVSITAVAEDAAGNMSEASVALSATRDTVAPVAVIDTGPQGTVASDSATFEFSVVGPATLECRLDGAPFASCSSPETYTDLPDGSHTFRVRARDAAGNQGPEAPRVWTVDTQPPTVTITSGPSGVVASTSATFTFTSSEPSSFECRLDGGSFVPCTSPRSYEGLGQGDHGFAVRAADVAGNVGSDIERMWTVDLAHDTTPPLVVIGALPRFQRGTGFDVSWGGSDTESGVERFEVEVREARPNGAWTDWGHWVTSTGESTRFEGRTGSTYCFRATAVDGAGNASSPSEEACTAVPLNDTELRHRGRWRVRTTDGAYLGTSSMSKIDGARLVARGLEASDLTLLVTRCRRCGKVAVRFAGRPLGRFNLRAKQTQRAVELDIASFDAPRKGKLQIEVLTSKRRVCIEGLGVSRA